MKFLYPLFLLFITSVSFGQMDYAALQRKVSDKNSHFYYPELLERFRNSDSTLTSEDFEVIYYGGIFLDSYDPVKLTEAEQRIRELNYYKKYIEAYELADSLLREYPVSVQAYFEKGYACYNLKRFEEQEYNNKRYKVLIRTILRSGEGKSFSSAWFANLPDDEFEVLKYLNLEIREEAEIPYKDDIFDVFYLKSNKSRLKEAIFNVTRQIH